MRSVSSGWFVWASLACVPLVVAAERGEEIKLWPNGAPGSEGITAAEVSKPSVSPKNSKLPGNYTVTHYPSIYVFLPPKEKATGAAMVVAPGGGHTQLVMEKEGWEIADWLNSQGIAAFVLKYRLARAPDSKYTLPNEVYADAARSMRLVRSKAKEFGFDPSRLGFIGFSAGGEVAGMIETRFDAGKPDAADPVERFSSRPDFNILIYPFYRPGSVSRPAGGRQGVDAAPTAADQAPAPIQINPNATFPIPKDAPPVFMVCADDDRSHVEPTVKFYLELEANHISAEMHIYAFGEHGFALRPTKKPGAPVESWPGRMLGWLAERGFSRQ
jgi:acetyl esterase/lipase